MWPDDIPTAPGNIDFAVAGETTFSLRIQASVFQRKRTGALSLGEPGVPFHSTVEFSHANPYFIRME
jgi:hypothetical protein